MVILSERDIVLDKPIGKGSYGEVFKASYNGKIVAVKRCKKDNQRSNEDQLKEALFMREVSHNNIVNLEGFYWSKDGTFYMVMEYFPFTMQDVLRQKKKINIWSILTDIASGMEYLHSQHIIHRDLKESNILISEDGVAKIADFGVCRLFPSEATLLDGNMTCGGTMFFMAPELKSGAFTEKIDVYSFGVICGDVRKGLANDRDTAEFLEKIEEPCMSYKPEKRPSFTQILSQLKVKYNPPSVASSVSKSNLFKAKDEPVTPKVKKAHGETEEKKDEEKKVKRGRTAYIFFSNEVRPKLKEKNSGMSLIDISKLIGTMWHALSDEAKKKYVEMEKQDKARYEMEKEQNENEPHKKPKIEHQPLLPLNVLPEKHLKLITKEELKNLCSKLTLSVSGSKNELIERLNKHGISYEMFTLNQLKSMCSNESLPVSGNKDTLIERLKEANKKKKTNSFGGVKRNLVFITKATDIKSMSCAEIKALMDESAISYKSSDHRDTLIARCLSKSSNSFELSNFLNQVIKEDLQVICKDLNIKASGLVGDLRRNICGELGVFCL